MSLTLSVNFKAIVGKGNRIQIPTLISWEFKLASIQPLRLQLFLITRGIDQTLYAKMKKDGCKTLPKINAGMIKNQLGDEESFFIPRLN